MTYIIIHLICSMLTCFIIRYCYKYEIVYWDEDCQFLTIIAIIISPIFITIISLWLLWNRILCKHVDNLLEKIHKKLNNG